jgi:hypothetical protein
MLRATTKEKIDVPTTVPGMASRIVSETADKSRGKSRDVRLTDLITGFDNTGSRNVIDLNQGGGGIFKALASQPDGARGELGVAWKMGSGHSMAWEVVKGKPVIFDAQSGKMFKSDSDFSEIGASVKEAGFTRLDNIELNDDYLMRWLKNA